MSTTTSPVAPVQTRDIRSASVAYKRDKDHSTKWARGVRPIAGHQYEYPEPNSYGELVFTGKVRPDARHPFIGEKDHRSPKANYLGAEDISSLANRRYSHKVDTFHESNDHTTNPLSKSLLSMLPQHMNNATPAISTREPDTLFSYDTRGPTPGQKASRVALGGLIEQAEQKWIAEQTEKIIRGEYEVLDAQGEKTVLKKGKRSPKQKPKEVQPVVDEDDGFELV
ncbi:hypothetical protein GLAREA_11668 [Glarea lozoyensis ATCC 20868]|uniref:Uncharacterized protein n=2 Tax=Glarea lozoyensis TaxID=101852 RepID=S3CF09_GLAL2|nr:uncharacterized protein GLAREA_11668 [Glarea lozoyensis ATCC 20868]EHL01341.1 hypothetical protein M7I_2674 [Glarea lozoyensis 74030]EPE25087.1 hypothetical protein GLAREA_11668 [Glarea lozoyensis ATCC 20868]